MKHIFIVVFFLAPFTIVGQKPANVKSIDSIVLNIENDQSVIRTVYDTVQYVKEDGGDRWDSLFNHKEYFHKNGEVVKIVAWNKYADWRNDMLGYYHNGKAIKFCKGESFDGTPYYGQLDFEIYYDDDKEIKVSWLTPKPDNVMGVASDIFLKWAYKLVEGRK